MSNVVFDHKGHGFESLEEMCDWYHINQGTFLSRLDRGWTLEQALVTPVMENYRDYPKIKTIEDALKKDGSFYGEVKRRTGESEDSNPQVADVRRRGKPGPQYTWYDHKGIAYDSKEDMCHAYGISTDLYKSRVWDGWPVCYALEKVPGEYNFTDHQGNTFRYLSMMCRSYGIDKFEFQKRIDNGWTLEEALTLPSKPHKDGRKRSYHPHGRCEKR